MTLKTLALTIALGLAALTPAPANAQWTAPVTFEAFHGPLAAHGQWLAHPTYGQVWRPFGVAADWRPYYEGQWESTESGWSWQSDEPWAWATYHYGRWAWDNGWGWFWVPGYEWAPAWVDWRYDEGSVGWAPLAPVGWVFRDRPHHHHWVYVPQRFFVGHRVRTVAYGHVETDSFWSYRRDHWTTSAPRWHGRTHTVHVQSPAWRHERPNTWNDRHHVNEVRTHTRYESRPARPSYDSRPARPSYDSRPAHSNHDSRPARPSYDSRPRHDSRPQYQGAPVNAGQGHGRPGSGSRGGHDARPAHPRGR